MTDIRAITFKDIPNKNRRVVPWKNGGIKPRDSENLFRICWDYDLGEWVRDKKGAFLGYYI